MCRSLFLVLVCFACAPTGGSNAPTVEPRIESPAQAAAEEPKVPPLESSALDGRWRVVGQGIADGCNGGRPELAYEWQMKSAAGGEIEVVVSMASSDNQEGTAFPSLTGRLGFDRVVRLSGSANRSMPVGSYGQVLASSSYELELEPADGSLVGTRSLLSARMEPTEGDDLMIFPCLTTHRIQAKRQD